jgi:hypothetical protein
MLREMRGDFGLARHEGNLENLQVKRTAGKTAYAIHPELRAFIAKYKKITETKLCDELLNISGGID